MSRKFQKVKHTYAAHRHLFTYNLHCIYIESSIINTLEMIQNLWEFVCRLYANTFPFYIRVCSTCGFWYQQEFWKQLPMGTKGWLYMEIFSKDPTQVHFFGLWKGGHEVRVWIHIFYSLLWFEVFNMCMGRGGRIYPVAQQLRIHLECRRCRLDS